MAKIFKVSGYFVDTNGRLIKAMPMIYVGGWVKLSKLEERKI